MTARPRPWPSRALDLISDHEGLMHPRSNLQAFCGATVVLEKLLVLLSSIIIGIVGSKREDLGFLQDFISIPVRVLARRLSISLLKEVLSALICMSNLVPMQVGIA